MGGCACAPMHSGCGTGSFQGIRECCNGTGTVAVSLVYQGFIGVSWLQAFSSNLWIVACKGQHPAVLVRVVAPKCSCVLCGLAVCLCVCCGAQGECGGTGILYMVAAVTAVHPAGASFHRGMLMFISQLSSEH